MSGFGTELILSQKKPLGKKEQEAFDYIKELFVRAGPVHRTLRGDTKGPSLEPFDLIPFHCRSSRVHFVVDKNIKEKAGNTVRRLHKEVHLTRESDNRYINPRFWKYRLAA